MWNDVDQMTSDIDLFKFKTLALRRILSSVSCISTIL